MVSTFLRFLSGEQWVQSFPEGPIACMQELTKIYAEENSERRALCTIIEALPRPEGSDALEEIIDLLCHARGKEANEVSFRTVGPPCLPACELYPVLSHQVQSQSNFKFSNAV